MVEQISNSRSVFVIPFDYRGFYYTHLEITTHDSCKVQNIHHDLGSILGSAHSGHDIQRICDAIVAMRFSQSYIIGGDGTHGVFGKIHEEFK
ncbi:6-phosphofructokinase (pseudogenised) [Chondrus crispus]|uniref:6-phosphofructokinase (Pseudogenised) n=1 Tax=Chondrus crispus TaxID=2769 RepID=R7Q6P2_CHOCR|nr:6-phosphofructokinase (pseudogenised) [Chondrus crispus]CDF33036.1 6-phosphofructokinase (pseudogenised) [Chondrus crispus]|eukprot:XP_005712839.1 6-phosphofructokinase (pseudogenised) [Chondrus crispus]